MRRKKKGTGGADTDTFCRDVEGTSSYSTGSVLVGGYVDLRRDQLNLCPCRPVVLESTL